MEFDYSVVNGEVKFNSYERVTTPLGEAEWAHLVEPDTKFNVEGDYKVNIILKGDDALSLRAVIDNAHEEAFKIYLEAAATNTKAGKRPRAVKKSDIVPYEELEDGIMFKLKRKAGYTNDIGERIDFDVPLYNSIGKKYSDEDRAALKIGNGSTIRAMFDILPYNMATSGVGISLRLVNAQLKNIVEYESASPYDSVDDEYVEEAEDNTYTV